MRLGELIEILEVDGEPHPEIEPIHVEEPEEQEAVPAK